MRYLVFILLLHSLTAQAQSGSITAAECRELAVANSPAQQRKQYAASIAVLQSRNLSSNNLPRINLGGQATLQSDVFKFPFENPLFQAPNIPLDQYKLTLDASQRIWDGNSDRLVRQQRELERDLATAQADVEAFQVREVVTDIFYKALLADETRKILENSVEDLEKRRKQAEAAVKEGTALRTTVDQLSIQMLKTTQQIEATKADKAMLLQLLEHWTGRTMPPTLVPSTTNPTASATRPEYQVFALQDRQLELSKSVLRLRTQPRVEAFGQGGLGRPNPFNFFETGFSPFGIIGLRVNWTPIDWGNLKRESQILDAQRQYVAIQRSTLDQRLRSTEISDSAEIQKYLAQLPEDDKIIQLQSDIVRRTEAQVANGVTTSTDYIAQVNLLTQAKLNRKFHEIQAQRAADMAAARR